MGARLRLSLRNSGSLVLLLAASFPVFPQGQYANKLAPYVASPQKVVDRMLELAAVKPGELVYDLGCGDGRVLITAAQKFQARAVGVEISDKLVQRATEKIAGLGLQDRVKIVQGDLQQADLSSADVVVLYLMTGSNEKIRPKLEKTLKPGARVVSYSYEIPGWKPVRVDRTDAPAGHPIYVYEMAAASKK